jgi:hypothetical protein
MEAMNEAMLVIGFFSPQLTGSRGRFVGAIFSIQKLVPWLWMEKIYVK